MKIFVISLKDAISRRKEITKQMKVLGISFEFFDAVDGRNNLPKKYESMVDRKRARHRLGKDMSDGEFACALSHALVYKKITDEKIKHSIVLEDDVILSSDFGAMVKQKSCEKTGKDFLYLYHLYARAMIWGKMPFLKGYDVCNMAKTPNGAVAYYISVNMAKQLSAEALPISWVSDWGVDIASYNSALIVPRIVTHPPMEKSNLENNRTGKNNIAGQFGIAPWVWYKFKKIFSKKVSQCVEGK